MLPTLDFNEYSDIYTLTLSRDDKEVTHKFNTFVFGTADTFPTIDVPDPKFTYYMWAKYDENSFMFWITKEELNFIKSRKDEIREDLARYRESKRQIREYIANKSNN